MSTGIRHPRTREIVLRPLLGKTIKEVAYEFDTPYTTVVDILKRYIEWVPRLKKDLPP